MNGLQIFPNLVGVLGAQRRGGGHAARPAAAKPAAAA